MYSTTDVHMMWCVGGSGALCH